MFRRAVKLIAEISLITVIITGGCGKNNSLAPFEPEIVNNADSFQFQATDLDNVDFTRDYSWDNNSSSATINHSSAVNDGSTLLVIYDADNNEVYSSHLLPSANEQTVQGSPGTWTVRVILNNASGTINFRVEPL